MAEDLILKMERINKSFPGVKALSDVDFTLRRGEIHALLGENGAGKSTLIKVLTGVHNIDAGTIMLQGRSISVKSPEEAQRLGISTVYQEVNLCPNLTVAENIFIGRQPKKMGRIDWDEMERRATEMLERLNLNIDVKRPLSSYSVAIQQMVAIARAVDISSGVLILDEPTSSLDHNEVQQLFNVMRKLKGDGMAIIFVTHFLDQVYEIADRITVLRNGTLVGEYETSKLPRKELVAKMIGKALGEKREIEKMAISSEVDEGQEVLRTVQLGKRGLINPVDLSIKKGEVLGLAGLLGSGRTEIVRLLFGIDKADQGVIYLDNEKMGTMYPKKAIDGGMGFCPEDRKVEGIAGELTVRENIVLALQASKGLFSYIPLKEQKKIAQKYIDMLQIKAANTEVRTDHLSGGNQQKVILARWLATNPKLLILDEPTRGIDVGSKMEIQKLILTLAAEGMAILFISSELDEMINCCDRIVVLRDRAEIGQLTADHLNESTILYMIAEGGREREQVNFSH